MSKVKFFSEKDIRRVLKAGLAPPPVAARIGKAQREAECAWMIAKADEYAGGPAAGPMPVFP